MATNPKQQFLDAYDKEHATTMRVLRAYPTDKLDLRPHPKLKTARELAFIFVLERVLATKIWNDEFAKAPPTGGATAKPPENWNDLLSALERAHKDFRDLVTSTPDAKLLEKVGFFVAPKTMGELPRVDWAWYLLHDQIHHRGQFSVYLRMAEGKVPSIYGATADEKWI